MGAFNTLNAIIHCGKCKSKYAAQIQFKYGEVWQHNYKIGDELIWGTNEVGGKHLSKVKSYGVLATPCPVCHNEDAEYDLYIENNILKSIQPMADFKDYLKEKGGNYAILN